MLIPDDITSVEFHAQQQDRLVTGGTDGLVNVLDLSKSDEEEALVTSYNTEDSVASVMWREEEVVVRTHTEAVQTWSPATSRTVRRSRREVAEVMRRGVEDHVYMAGVGVEEGEVRLLAGSRFLPSPCLRSLALTQHGLQPRADFLRPGSGIRVMLCLFCVGVPATEDFLVADMKGAWPAMVGESWAFTLNCMWGLTGS